ncbi:hypothetical protein [Sulfitobacter sp. MF3-043]|uniref:hypothetical protein n=1 Tax=Sulfitobacter sediminivivens TaxID=3252902 RepID=UPI0036DE7EAC
MTDATSETEQKIQTRMNSNRPVRKVTASMLAGAIVQLLLWLNGQMAGPTIPPEVQGALTILVSFVVAYMVPPASTEQVIKVRKA